MILFINSVANNNNINIPNNINITYASIQSAPHFKNDYKDSVLIFKAQKTN